MNIKIQRFLSNQAFLVTYVNVAFFFVTQILFDPRPKNVYILNTSRHKYRYINLYLTLIQQPTRVIQYFKIYTLEKR